MTLVRNQDDVMRVIMEEFYYGCKIKNDAVAENDGICLKHVLVWAGDLVYRTDPIFNPVQGLVHPEKYIQDR